MKNHLNCIFFSLFLISFSGVIVADVTQEHIKPGWQNDIERLFINSAQCDQIIDKKFYTICYSHAAKGALFVSYRLSREHVNRKNIKKRPRFYPEKSIPKAFRTYPNDYTHNEFHADRGHLAPDAAFDWSQAALHSVYSMANIVPQYYLINRQSWRKAERYARMMAVKLGEVTVINGVMYGDKPYTRLKKSGIAYPAGFWKMIVGPEKKFSRCFYYGNSKKDYQKNDKLRDHRVECRLLGLYR